MRSPCSSAPGAARATQLGSISVGNHGQNHHQSARSPCFPVRRRSTHTSRLRLRVGPKRTARTISCRNLVGMRGDPGFGGETPTRRALKTRHRTDLHPPIVVPTWLVTLDRDRCIVTPGSDLDVVFQLIQRLLCSEQVMPLWRKRMKHVLPDVSKRSLSMDSPEFSVNPCVCALESVPCRQPLSPLERDSFTPHPIPSPPNRQTIFPEEMHIPKDFGFWPRPSGRHSFFRRLDQLPTSSS